MTNKTQDWPSISISESDQAIVKEITRFPGVLQGTEAKDTLMIAAALAVELDLPELPESDNKGPRKDVMHQSLLRSPSYHDYRQYMLLIFYLTAGHRDLKTMSDFKAITDNFVKLAHVGLQYLKMEYLQQSGSEKLEELFGDYIEKRTAPSLS